ncbi:MAG: AIPR family protein [Chlorobia bacterium]|nr:AIPR family protein [Fimbriimonadaceae bacterium]
MSFPSNQNASLILKGTLDQVRLGTESPLPADKFFELFVPDQHLKDRELSVEQISEGVIGGGLDGGIDAFYLFVNDVLAEEDIELDAFRNRPTISIKIYQSKTENGFGQDTWLKLIPTITDLLDLSVDLTAKTESYNSDLLGIMRRFRQIHEYLLTKSPRLDISIVYASYASEVHVAAPVKGAEDTLVQNVLALFPGAAVSIEYLSATQLLDLYQRSPAQIVVLPFTGSVIIGSNSYVVLVKLGDYVNGVIDEEKKLRVGLLDANVRDFQTLTADVNKEIFHALENPGGSEDFWWLNNGITIVASGATVNGNQLVLSDTKIVNGLQTTHVLYEYAQSMIFEIGSEERVVLVKVLVTDDEDTRDRIIRATNRQTPISPVFLSATEPFHRNLESYLLTKGWYYDRRKNHYRLQGKPSHRIVSMRHIAQAYMATALQRPNDARGRPLSVVKKEYELVFNSSKPIDVYLKALEVTSMVDELLTVVAPNTRTNIRFAVAMLAVSQLVGSIYYDDSMLSRINVASLTEDDVQNLALFTMSALADYMRRELVEPDVGAKSKEFDQDLLLLWDASNS